ncbi:MAG: ABC transporter substrate binding protein [Chloroflexi bacterium]|nr:ABC transporter substrate binding protein [Chloroflexota bacterium]
MRKVLVFRRLKGLLLLLVFLCLLLGPATLADGDAPTLAFLRFGNSPDFQLTDKAVLDMLEAYGYVSAAERATLQAGNDLHGEKINILYREAGFDLPTANLMVEDALDEGADVLLTLSTQVGMIAANAISDMDDPPVLVFAIVALPYTAGIAEAPCIKPDNITGTEMFVDTAEWFAIPYKQNPDFANLGVIIDPNGPSAEGYKAGLEQFVMATGANLEVATATTAPEMALAADTLIDKGVDAIFLPPRTSSPSGLPAVVTASYGVPVYSALVSDVIYGVTVGNGFEGWYREGVIAARMVIGYLRGELDIATTGIAVTPSFKVAVNLDAADTQGVTISEALLAEADYVIEDDLGAGAALESLGFNLSLPEMSLEERVADDRAFLENLRCTPEMIAEQRAALEAQS